jgi:hypothetical protein
VGYGQLATRMMELRTAIAIAIEVTSDIARGHA